MKEDTCKHDPANITRTPHVFADLAICSKCGADLVCYDVDKNTKEYKEWRAIES
jgi:hypothetical protein